VFYAALANFTKSESVLGVYQFLFGLAAMGLIVSAFLYGIAQTDPVKYRRGLSQWSFGIMMFVAWFSSSVLVVPNITGWIEFGNREVIVLGGWVIYLLVGLIGTSLFCRSRL